MRVILVFIILLSLSCEDRNESSVLIGDWRMKLDMFNNDEYLSSVEGNITYHNSGHAEFTDYATGDHHAFNWDLSDNNLILVNGATGIEIVYQIESFSKTAAFLSCDNSIKLRLVRI